MGLEVPGGSRLLPRICAPERLLEIEAVAASDP
jgi:hypothetical protein